MTHYLTFAEVDLDSWPVIEEVLHWLDDGADSEDGSAPLRLRLAHEA